MAVISSNTFDPLKRYVSVRLQQGVPIVDADWNELDDVRKFELRAYLKWFVGDGVPEGNDGFRVIGQGVPNDFLITAGPTASGPPAGGVEQGLRQVGRCLVDGLDVIIQGDVGFRAQPLHLAAPGSAARAAKYGVPVVPELPLLNGTLLVYLDVWERLVTPDEDGNLLFAGLGTESCARLCREWVVRARNAAVVPKAGDADYLAGHSYYAIARVLRRSTNGAVTASDVSDARAKRLLVPPANLIDDVLGTSADRYRMGLDRPPISLRDAINALLRGELPSTPDAVVSVDPNTNLTQRGFFADASGGLMAVWPSNRVAAKYQVFASRLDLSNLAGGFSAPTQITSGAIESRNPHAAVLPNGDLFVAYQTDAATGGDIYFKRAPLAGLAAATAQPVVTGTAANTRPFVVVSGDRVVVFFHIGGLTNQWHYRRYDHIGGGWLDGAPVVLAPLPSLQVTTTADLHATKDAAGNIWAAFRVPGGIYGLTLNPFTAVVSNRPAAAWDMAGTDQAPFVLAGANGDIWVFWQGTGISFTRFTGGSWKAPQAVPGLAAADVQPCVTEDAYGGVWLTWSKSGTEIFLMRRDPWTGSWGQPRQLTVADAFSDTVPFALIAPNRALWIFWASDRSGSSNTYYKQLITSI